MDAGLCRPPRPARLDSTVRCWGCVDYDGGGVSQSFSLETLFLPGVQEPFAHVWHGTIDRIPDNPSIYNEICHLSPKIPNYLLESCHQETSIFQVKPVKLLDSLNSLSLRLWDEKTHRLVSFRILKQYQPAA